MRQNSHHSHHNFFLSQMARSTVSFSSSRVVDPVVSPIRLTHSVKLKPTDSTTVKDVELLTEDVTGLDKKAFEELSINIYGVGGYYLQHMDSSGNEVRTNSPSAQIFFSTISTDLFLHLQHRSFSPPSEQIFSSIFSTDLFLHHQLRSFYTPSEHIFFFTFRTDFL